VLPNTLFKLSVIIFCAATRAEKVFHLVPKLSLGTYFFRNSVSYTTQICIKEPNSYIISNENETIEYRAITPSMVSTSKFIKLRDQS